MKINIAKTAGFCMGVRRAVDLALDLKRQDPPLPIVTYGPLIHNPQTLNLLESRGVSQKDSIDDINGGTVIIRAHGISPQARLKLEEKRVNIVDATCPRVNRVQALISKHAQKGDFCVIVGDEDHPEVQALIGFATAGAVAISGPEMIKKLENAPLGNAVCVVAQTTQEPAKFYQIVEFLKNQKLNLNIYNTICDSTRKRQTEVKELAKKVDMVIVVGGRGSGNTKRLTDVARESCHRVLHIETADEISETDLIDINAIGVTAGASTPNWQIRSVIEKIKQIVLSKRVGIWSPIRRLVDMTIMTYVWAALGGAGLTFVCDTLQGVSISIYPAIVTALFVFSMHLLNRIQERSGALRFNTPEIALFYSKHEAFLSLLGGVSAVIAMAVSYKLGTDTMVAVMGMIITGMLYPVPVLRWMKNERIKWKALKDLPGSKTPLVAMGWAMAASIIPAFERNPVINLPALFISFISAALMVFWRTALSDLIDVQGDRIGGRDTLPIIFGGRVTEKMLSLLLFFLSLLFIFASMFNITTAFGYILLLNILIFKFLFDFYKKGHLVDRLIYEGLVDGNFVLAGIFSLIYSRVA
ncbi:MAG: 4-hydroxy-3-methylbut-2-enyl diphosphate reductase [Desulfomonilaceae bacterium]